jgi:hypothetical protein
MGKNLLIISIFKKNDKDERRLKIEICQTDLDGNAERGFSTESPGQETGELV